jgi:hypothetical protein
MAQKINPNKFIKIIYEAHVILFTTKRINDRSQTSKKISSKGNEEQLLDLGHDS